MLTFCERYDAGIQSFDTANVGFDSSFLIGQRPSAEAVLSIFLQVYSNGLSEVILGKAIKKLKLPREEIVVMTKVNFLLTSV